MLIFSLRILSFLFIGYGSPMKIRLHSLVGLSLLLLFTSLPAQFASAASKPGQVQAAGIGEASWPAKCPAVIDTSKGWQPRVSSFKFDGTDETFIRLEDNSSKATTGPANLVGCYVDFESLLQSDGNYYHVGTISRDQTGFYWENAGGIRWGLTLAASAMNTDKSNPYYSDGHQFIFNENEFYNLPEVTRQTEIKSSDYSFVAALARARILGDVPIASNSVKLKFLFEDSVPQANRTMIQDGADFFISHFGNLMTYKPNPITVVAYSTLKGGEALAKSIDPKDPIFQKDMTESFARQVDISKYPCLGMGGFSSGYKRLVVMNANCENKTVLSQPTQDPVVTPHELTHELQNSITQGRLVRTPVWLCEGQANVVGAVMSYYQGKDYWDKGGREQWAIRIPTSRPRNIDDLKIMEGETNADVGKTTDASQVLSEYTTGAALSEYLIAWGGFKNSILVPQIALKSPALTPIDKFRSAFKTVYGESLDEFYAQALPYVNFVANNPRMVSTPSSQQVAFIDSQITSLQSADELRTKEISTAKVSMDAKVKEYLDAQAALTNVAAPKKTTITCTKGKLTKKVTASKPLCPTGFKVK